jgi:hypothetical protein
MLPRSVKLWRTARRSSNHVLGAGAGAGAPFGAGAGAIEPSGLVVPIVHVPVVHPLAQAFPLLQQRRLTLQHFTLWHRWRQPQRPASAWSGMTNPAKRAAMRTVKPKIFLRAIFELPCAETFDR